MINEHIPNVSTFGVKSSIATWSSHPEGSHSVFEKEGPVPKGVAARTGHQSTKLAVLLGELKKRRNK